MNAISFLPACFVYLGNILHTVDSINPRHCSCNEQGHGMKGWKLPLRGKPLYPDLYPLTTTRPPIPLRKKSQYSTSIYVHPLLPAQICCGKGRQTPWQLNRAANAPLHGRQKRPPHAIQFVASNAVGDLLNHFRNERQINQGWKICAALSLLEKSFSVLRSRVLQALPTGGESRDCGPSLTLSLSLSLSVCVCVC